MSHRFFPTLLFLLLLLQPSCTRPSPTQVRATPAEFTASQPPLLALIHGRLVDGRGGPPISDAVVILQGSRISLLGAADDVSQPEQAQVIDLEGATILPGFINAHVHGAFDRVRLQAWAQAGVTSVCDLHAFSVPPDYTLRDAVNRDPSYARLLTAGNFITVPEGYPIQPWGGRAITVTSVEEARQATQRMVDDGADLIKIALDSGGSFDQSIPTLTDEQAVAIVETAHINHTVVAAHVLLSEDLRRAIAAGVDDIAHMVTDRLPNELVQQMIAKGIYWTPTLELWKNVGYNLDQAAIANLKTFVSAGGKVALGTDFEGYDKPFQLGMPLIEIDLMQQAGMTPMQIIVAATAHAAAVCNQASEIGTLEPGKVADLLIVRSDPLQDLQALGQPAWVIHNGVVIRAPPDNP